QESTAQLVLRPIPEARGSAFLEILFGRLTVALGEVAQTNVERHIATNEVRFARRRKQLLIRDKPAVIVQYEIAKMPPLGSDIPGGAKLQRIFASLFHMAKQQRDIAAIQLHEWVGRYDCTLVDLHRLPCSLLPSVGQYQSSRQFLVQAARGDDEQSL